MHATLFFFALTGLLAPALAADGDCQPLASGSAPTPTPNTPEAFASFLYYDVVANKTRYPANYEKFMESADSAIRDDAAYLTYKELDEYDVYLCAIACDTTKDCASCEYISFILQDNEPRLIRNKVNIYFQRHPSLSVGEECPNPPANVIIRCALFSEPMSAANATNHGEVRGPADRNGEKFEVMMRGSNGKHSSAWCYMLWMVVFCQESVLIERKATTVSFPLMRGSQSSRP